jgi:hypothetical protein
MLATIHQRSNVNKTVTLNATRARQGIADLDSISKTANTRAEHDPSNKL